MWQEIESTEGTALFRSFQFKSFLEVIAFMTEAAQHIEKQNHHPEWSNIYNKLDVKLWTHDAGNTITNKDRQLADTLDTLYAGYT